MATGDALKRGMRDVADAMKRVAHEAHEAEAQGGDGTHINVARRTNIQVAKNVGHDGGTTHASAAQDAPITQDGIASDDQGTETVVVRNHK